ncbi:MAG: CD225/dispanin family protein [Tannerella sp.]|jgi:hypothetical protein|nr:CD225/dispanin family protein [Tannerella sp.]
MEEREYFYLNGTTKVGPLSLEGIKSAPITASTLVWNNSLPDWVEAQKLPELEGFFAIQSAPLAPPPVQPVTQPSAGSYNAGGAPPMPDNYLVWAILATIFCCWPLGIPAIIKSSKVSSLYSAGDYAGAQSASADAKKWTIIAAIVGGIFVILYIILVVVLGLGGALAGLNY